MNLSEVLVAAVVFALAANGSAGLWAAGARWQGETARRQERLLALERELLRRERALRSAAQTADADGAASDCDAAAAWLAQRLGAGSPGGGTAAGTVAVAGSGGEAGAWLTLQLPEEGVERRRWFSAAAHGLCRVPNAQVPEAQVPEAQTPVARP